MFYKTIALELLRDTPDLYERLRSSNRLLPSMDAYAIDLKALHEEWKEKLAWNRPESASSQIASEALELAIMEFREHLPCDTPMEGNPTLTLDGAMDFIRRHTPHA